MQITEEQINSASSMAILTELVANCERCSLYKTKIKDVVGVGSEHAEVLFIGEAPGKSEDEQGEPFVGAAGKFLNEMLEGIGLSRADIYIGNVLKHRPPNNRDPLPAEADACWPFLRRQIELINPKLIVFLGRHSMNRFFPTLKISTVHGNAFRKDFWGRKQVFLALYHPAAALYNGGMRETLKTDFAKIPKILAKIDEEKTKNDSLKESIIIQEHLF
jgi:uracil-DNA glycosylase family 4